MSFTNKNGNAVILSKKILLFSVKNGFILHHYSVALIIIIKKTIMMKSGWIKMTSFLLVFCFCLNGSAQTNDYKNEWKKVDELVKKNLPKSALDEVKKIYNLSKKNKQDAQIIKSLVYITNLQQETREENLPQSIKDIEAEIPVTKEPAASILKSYLAGLYWNYYQQNRYQIYNRTQTSSFTKTDIATWGAADFHKKVSELYLQSIKNEKQLQQINIEAYKAIIIKGNMRPLRPTLYDLLAQQALAYFKNDERDINKPEYAFEINDPAAFANAKTFAAHTFKTSDSLSLQWKALIVYQQLLQFHLNDKKPSALIDADIDRIEYVYQKSIHADKDSLYLAALENISKKYAANPVASQAPYLIAQFYFNLGSKYQPNGDTTLRFEKLKARTIAEKILQQDSASEGKANAFNLLQQINQKEISFEVEKVNVPAKPFRVLVNYKNVDKLFLKLVRTDNKLRSQLENQYDDKYWQALNAAPAYRSWEQSLPATNDFQTHAVEIKADALPVGEYVLIASSDAKFNDKKTLLAARLLYISNISFINSEGRFFILNRESGHPLQNAKVQVWQQEYDYKASTAGRKKAGEYSTDKNGFFQIKDNDGKERNNYLLEITTSDDHLFMNDWMYDYNYYPVENASPEEELNTHIFLFTDRSIYRPGQTVFFKGITINANKNQRKNKVYANYTTTIYLRDANYQLVDSLSFTTNEYGSFSGKFNLPQTGLNGRFNLLAKDNKGNASIQVEDYKRPKFYVDFEKIKNTFNVNDTIHITGLAKAYAGNNIDGATVKYRVVRQPRFIYPWLFRKWWLPQAEPMEIAHGEAKTDADGKFLVAFQAIPDLKIDKKFDPVFDYRIYADVTDINGETRSNENIVSVSYKSIQLQVAVPSPLRTDSLKNISVITKNMNDVFAPALVKISIYKLQPEKRLVRNRYWQQPDQFVMSKEDYIKFFPHDEYKNETDYTSWEKGEKVFEKTDSTRENGIFSIQDKSFPTGWYTIETETTDKNGEIIKDVQYVELYDPSNNKLADPKYLWTKGTDDILEPGQIATINIGSSAEDVFLVQQINKNSGSPKTAQDNFDFINLDNEKKSFQYAIGETDRGGFGVAYFFVKDNRFFSFSDVVKVSWSNKELEVE
ncbi:MAG TPA: MG2 domain-containing protein, partial [Chitinophagaceae bacterium]